ncbi:MAG TPA: hypothetical protein PKD17_12515 [Cellvibrionaceae bacterium]|nr:hypothetical protein [Cellvibrionaceae bacterium]HMW72643.1 hypothetical protein [Cellvibrionaceae bacterium]HMY39199.1 hypothetical protein [Marinagarivorans sp.]
MQDQNISDVLGTAIRFNNPLLSQKSKSKIGRAIYIEPAAEEFLLDLNGYDQLQVCKGIEALASTPSPQDGMASTLRPDFLKAKFASASIFNYVIKYRISSSAVIVTSIKLNKDILGAQKDSSKERSALYEIERIGKVKFTSSSSLSEIESLKDDSWRAKGAVRKVVTRHAAVNGMLNDYRKAGWLMGVHADVAFGKDEFDSFTLFHNPSQTAKLDFYESVRDNLGVTTENAKQLSAILRQVQQDGQPVKWVVHSQGGIIFKQALAYHLKHYSGQSLNLNSVVFHAGGNNKRVTDKLLNKVGIRREAPDRDNPFDMVPNLAGFNHLSPAAITRSLRFSKKVAGENSSIAESPHTLPFLTLEAYHHFLVLAGDFKSAKYVDRYMQKQARKGH